MKTISVIIPTKDRPHHLYHTLQCLSEQTLRPELFEVIVINDGGKNPETSIKYPFKISWIKTKGKGSKGPATARNLGAEKAENEILLFIGDDNFPNKYLLWFHNFKHCCHEEPIAIQGYIDWHPDLMPDTFREFITGEGGFQFNWNSLKTETGWKEKADGWFVTANVSIDKTAFLLEQGFNTKFKIAAWEDIELGYRLTRKGIVTYFQPHALVYHHHRITFNSFIERQYAAGRARIDLAALQPELGIDLLAGILDSNNNYEEQLDLALVTNFNVDPEIQPLQKHRWGNVLHSAAIKGAYDELNERGGLWSAVPHIKGSGNSKKALHCLIEAAHAFEDGNLGRATIELEWAMHYEQNSWAIYAALGELYAHQKGNRLKAIQSFQKAIELDPNNSDWPAKRLQTL